LSRKAPVRLSGELIPIAEALTNSEAAKRELVANNMISINSYVNLLKTDIVSLLDQANDRSEALDEHMALLASYHTDTKARLI
jgi:hypothetical protein